MTTVTVTDNDIAVTVDGNAVAVTPAASAVTVQLDNDYTATITTTINNNATQLDANVSSGTTFVTDAALDTGYIGAMVVLCTFDDKTEVRRITGISGTTVTVDAAIAKSHSAGDIVFILADSRASPWMWGAHPGGTAAGNATRLAAMLLEVVDRIPVQFSTGTYQVDTALTFTDRVHLYGSPGTTLQATAAMSYVLGNTVSTAGTIQHLIIRDIWIDGNSLATNGLVVYKVSRSNTSAISGINVTGCTGDGVKFEECQGGDFGPIQSDSNTGNGILIQGCNSSLFRKVKGRSNTLSGIKITNDPGGSGGCTLIDAHGESNTVYGIHLDGVTSKMALFGGRCEGNTDDGIHINDCTAGGIVTGFQAISGAGTGSNYGVNLQGTSALWQINGNLIAHSSGNSNYATVNDGSSGGLHVIGPNTNFSAVLELATRTEKLHDELITNTTFEADVANWTASTATIAQDATQAQAGTYSAKLTLTGSNGRMYEAVTLVDGAIYYVSAYVYDPTTGGLTTGPRLRIDTGDGTINTAASTTTKDAWVQLSGYFVATGTSGQLGLQGVGSNTEFCYWDTITLKRVLMPAARAISTYNGTAQFRDELPASGLNW